MTVPVSIRLEDDVRSDLEAEAKNRGIPLATLLREIATAAARDVRRARIREESRQVAAQISASPEAKAFYDDWGTPTAIIGDAP
jgi:predicted DNA-binding protein